jgi:hypothetical protein
VLNVGINLQHCNGDNRRISVQKYSGGYKQSNKQNYSRMSYSAAVTGDKAHV